MKNHDKGIKRGFKTQTPDCASQSVQSQSCPVQEESHQGWCLGLGEPASWETLRPQRSESGPCRQVGELAALRLVCPSDVLARASFLPKASTESKSFHRTVRFSLISVFRWKTLL